MKGKKEKPTGSLYHLSHGQREPEGFLVRSLSQSRTRPEKANHGPIAFFHARKKREGVYYRCHEQLRQSSRDSRMTVGDVEPNVSPISHASFA
jgi:hypothetical protein